MVERPLPRLASARHRPPTSGGLHRLELVGELDAHGAEAFALEVRRLLKRYAREIADVRVETSTVHGETPSP